MNLPALLAGVSLVSLLAGPCDVPELNDGAAPAGETAVAPVSPNHGFVSVNAGVGCAFRDDGTRLCWNVRSARLPQLPDELAFLDGPFDLDGDLCWIDTDGTLECQKEHMDDIVGPPEDPFPGYEQFPFPGRRFTALSGGRFACAIDVEGALACTDYGYPIDWAWDGPGAHPTEGEFVSVSAGDPHMCGVRVGGKLLCWSDHYYRRRSPAVMSPPAGEFTSVSVGDEHACAVRVGGELVCWGADERDSGKLSPPEGLFKAVAIRNLGSTSCGLRPDGEVECWGRSWNEFGGVWPQGPFVALDVDLRICALRTGGEVTCWGAGSGMHRPPSGAFVALDAGPKATCGLRPDGQIDCWGYHRELNGGWSPLAWEPPAGPFTAVSVGDDYACALRPSGDVACWGRGKLGPYRSGADDEERENRRRLQPPPGPFSAISAFDEFTCGLRPDGEIDCWGMYDADNQVGDAIDLADPPAGPFTAVRTGFSWACGLRPGGRAVCWNAADGSEKASVDGIVALIGGSALPCGLRSGGELACAEPNRWSHRNAPEMAFRSVATSASPGGHSCGLDQDGEITCWSGGVWHEPTPPGPFTAVTVGSFYSCGLRPDGTAECWTPHWPPTADPVRNSTDTVAPGA